MLSTNRLLYFFLYVFLARPTECRRTVGNDEKLIVILANGFPGNLYRSYLHLDSFKTFKENGVWSTVLFPVFPSLTLPNLHSFSTGMLPQKHGIVHDYMYDKTKNAYFMAGTMETDFEADWWNNAEPFWITAQKSGLDVAMFFWPGCQTRYGRSKVKTCFPYYFNSGSATLNEQNVHDVIKAVDVHDMVFAYYDTMDQEAHLRGRHGFARVQHNNSVGELDRILNVLLSYAKKASNVNVVVVSAHGVADSSRHHLYYLEDFLDMDLIHVSIGYGAVKQIIPKTNRAHHIFTELRHRRPIPKTKIYYTNASITNLKKRYHYETTNRIHELVLISEAGHGVYNKPGSFHQVPIATPNDYTFGMHGFDNHHTEMLGMFLAHGPAFKSGFQKSPVFIVDFHDMVCNLYELPCNATDGDPNRFSDVFAYNFGRPITDVHEEDIAPSSTVSVNEFSTSTKPPFVILAGKSNDGALIKSTVTIFCSNFMVLLYKFYL